MAPNRFGCHAQGTGSCLLPQRSTECADHVQTTSRQPPDQHWKALHGPPPELMAPLADQPGEIGFCAFTKVNRVEITLRGEPLEHLLAACGGVPIELPTLRLHHDRLIVVLGSDWGCQLPVPMALAAMATTSASRPIRSSSRAPPFQAIAIFSENERRRKPQESPRAGDLSSS
ncbi:MAG: hypothetical protein EBZ51_09535 [Synechococcaceae bacterium WB9_2_112]|nr:hypothetical protein [Synechococcaceae bacterium WB9_2_112]